MYTQVNELSSSIIIKVQSLQPCFTNNETVIITNQACVKKKTEQNKTKQKIKQLHAFLYKNSVYKNHERLRLAAKCFRKQKIICCYGTRVPFPELSSGNWVHLFFSSAPLPHGCYCSPTNENETSYHENQLKHIFGVGVCR